MYIIAKKEGDRRMTFLVMYDIEDNDTRNHVAKYLIRQGCQRIQNSIFMANLKHERYISIRNSLRAVQAAYDNSDSYIIIPLSSDEVANMSVFGRQLNMPLIMGNVSTMVF